MAGGYDPISHLLILKNGDLLDIANIGRNWMKLVRNPIELVVPERLGGVPGANLDRNGPTN